MGNRTAIEWTDATWTPIRARWFAPTNNGGGKERIGWHCEHASEGCRNCYAEAFNLRLGTGLPFKPDHLRREIRVPPEDPGGSREWRGDVTLFLDETMLLRPLRWRRGRMIFAGSMTDLFADFVPDAMLDRIFAVVTACWWHRFQFLTKRSSRARAYLSDPALPHRIARAWCEVGRDRPKGLSATAWTPTGETSKPRSWPLPNVWLGTSCEEQATADARIPDLLATPAAIRFVSAEPLLGPIDFTDLDPDGNFHPCGAHGWSSIWKDNAVGRSWLDWIIVGGESGPHARPMHPQWARDIRDQCAAAGVAFSFKQWGAWSPLRQPDDGFWPTDSGSCIRMRPDGIRADDGWPFQRVGKKFAGRLLDGVTHDQVPEFRNAA